MKKIIEKELGIPGDYQYKAIRSKNYLQANWHRNKLSCLEEVLDINNNVRILNLGVGSGNFELEYSRKVKEIVAVDYNDEALNFLSEKLKLKKIKNVKIIEKDIRKLSELKRIGKFDYIIAVDVIEHLATKDAGRVVKSLKRLLKTDGKICIITPNYKSAWVFIENIVDRLTLLPKLAGEQHLAKYERENITTLFRKHDFKLNYFGSFNLISFIFPLRSLSKLLTGVELKYSFDKGNLLVAVFSNKRYTSASIRRWNKFYHSDQENLYGNKIVKYIFDLGHKYIADKGKSEKGVFLDIGCGTGYHLKFEKLENNRTYICMDYNANMLGKIKEQNVENLVGDIKKIPLRKNSVDVAIASHVLEHIDGLDKAVVEMARVLKSKGKLLVVLPCDPGFVWKALSFFSPSRRRLKKLGLDYDEVMYHEHVNTFKYCKQKLAERFKIVDETYFPSKINNYNLNILCGLTLVKK